MKPYDGGAWRGVSRISNPAELHAAYDASGEMLMHLQKAIDYDVFARSLSIGAETMVMKFQPDQPMHSRYAVEHSFLSPQVGDEVVTISRLVNAFFRWEFNSCETLVTGDEVVPHRLRQRLPGHRADQPALLLPLGDQSPGQMVRLRAGDRPAGPARPGPGPVLRGRGSTRACPTPRSWASTGSWPTRYFDSARYHDFWAGQQARLDEIVLDWVASPDFDRLLVRTVQSTYPAHEHDQFIAHLRGLLGLWVRDESARLAASGGLVAALQRGAQRYGAC